MKSIVILISLCLFSLSMSAQNRNSVWCFGDSALIDFSDTSNIIVGSSGLDTRGSCASISNESGKLLFYSFTRAGLGGNMALIFDSTNSMMLNGDSLFGEGWYHELIIVPNPKLDSTYYLFTIGVTSYYGLHYSVIDMRLNNGLGAVVLKNQQINNLVQVDCLSAIKHGNGRDWWIISRKSDFTPGGSNNDWYIYLIAPDTIQAMPIQSIGAQNRTGLGQICFSKSGEKLVFTNLLNVVEVFDFDRCNGLLSNTLTIENDPGSSPYPFNWSCAFSGDESKLYVTANDTLSFLFQYDLNATNVTASKDTLWSINYPKYAGGGLKLAPDNRIYMASWYDNEMMFPYPYPDTVYNISNMNLSVINSPDSLGAACDFQPYSFYLGGKRTYVGLPNNPDYEMPALAGSPCDTLTSLNGAAAAEAAAGLHVYYASDWEKAFINADKLKGTTCKLQIFDVMGKLVFEEQRKISPPYYTKNLNCAGWAKGMYVVSLETDKEGLVKRFVIE